MDKCISVPVCMDPLDYVVFEIDEKVTPNTIKAECDHLIFGIRTPLISGEIISNQVWARPLPHFLAKLR